MCSARRHSKRLSREASDWKNRRPTKNPFMIMRRVRPAPWNITIFQRRCLNVPKSGLPLGVKMRHDSHYVDQIASHSRSVGRTIPITAIYPNPEQPRSEFGDLSELTASIKEKGVLE